MSESNLDIQSAVDRVMRYSGRGALIGFPTSATSCNLTTGVPTNGTKGWAKSALFINFISGGIYENAGTYDSSTWSLIPLTGGTLAALTVTALVATSATIPTLASTAATITTLTTPALVETGTETGAIGASTVALGTNFATAATLPAATARTYPTTAADDTVGVAVHANDKVTGRALWIGNGVSNKILKVYGPSGAVINGAAADAAFSSASGKGVMLQCLSSVSNTWLGW